MRYLIQSTLSLLLLGFLIALAVYLLDIIFIREEVKEYESLSASEDLKRQKRKELIEIELMDPRVDKGILLRIPQGYLVRKRTWKGGIQTEPVVIETRLPELLPAKALYRFRAKPNTSGFEMGMKKLNNGLYISIRQNVMSEQASDNIYNGILTEVQRNRLILRQDRVFELEHFLQQRCKIEIDDQGKETKNCWLIEREQFVFKHQDKKNGCFFIVVV